MTGYSDLWQELCSYDNLDAAFRKARKRKTLKPYVIEFESKLEENLKCLRNELLMQSYKPKPLETFILRDPKTRKISKSDFRDRVIHHALCNVIEPIFEKSFIYDSYANRLGKGTLKAVERFDYFKRKASKNNSSACFVFKADIKHYFEDVSHEILLNIIKTKINDKSILWLIKVILSNHRTTEAGKGMPLGNLTSQFFANVYLNELDQFVKHNLKARYYIRYVDDFIIFDSSREVLEIYSQKINGFLRQNLRLELHPDKSKILRLENGIGFLGFRLFFYHKLIKKKNLNKFERKFKSMREQYCNGLINREEAIEMLEGWLAYAANAHTYKYRRNLIKRFEKNFPVKQPKEIANPKRYENYMAKVNASNCQYSFQKTLVLFNKGLSIKQIAELRNIKESTVWQHLAKLIEYKLLYVQKVVPVEKIQMIKSKAYSANNTLKEIKERIHDNTITFDEINCVLASIRCKG